MPRQLGFDRNLQSGCVACAFAIATLLAGLFQLSNFSSNGPIALYDANLPTTEQVFQPISELIDLNTASKAKLTDLPSIGPKLAERIVEYRTENGNFASVDDLLFVPGIGEKKLDKIRPYCCVSLPEEDSPPPYRSDDSN